MAPSFVRTFLAASLASLAALVAVDIAVDPTQTWGTGLFAPLTWTARAQKVELLTRTSTTKPELLVLGSSRAMKVEPRRLAKRFGLAAFNAAVNSARTEDYVAMLRYATEEVGLSPKVIVLGVDIEAFHETLPVDHRLATSRELSPKVPDLNRFAIWVDGIADATTVDHLMLSIRSIRYTVSKNRPAAKYRFDDDGWIDYLDWDPAVDKGTHDLATEVERTRLIYLDRFKNFDKPGDGRIAHFEQFLAICRERTIRVYAYTTTLHPKVIASLEQHTSYRAVSEAVQRILQSAHDRGDLVFFEASTIDRFGGDPALFYDGAHMQVENERRMLDKLFAKGR